MEFPLHEKQKQLFESKATEILYGGAAGGGKSHAMRVIAIYYAMAVPGIQIYLFRRLSDDLKANHLYGSNGFKAMLDIFIKEKLVTIKEKDNIIVFHHKKKGLVSTIKLAHCQYETDKDKYQGADINLLLIDELTHFTESIYKWLRSRTRLGGLKVPKGIVGTLPRIIASSNPGGVGHLFVKQAFVDTCEPGQLYPQSDAEGGYIRQFLPAKLEDNHTMLENDPDYRKRLAGLGGARARAMLYGDWDAIEGAYFDDYSKEKHVIPPFPIPQDWTRIRAFDWGYSSPFCVLWGAVSNGHLLEMGKDKAPIYIPHGSIVIYREWYGSNGTKGKGLELTDEEIGRRTAEMEKGERIALAVADPSIFAREKKAHGISLIEALRRGGIDYQRASNTRIPGWQQVRYRLRGNRDGKPLLYFFDNCKHLLRTLPAMVYDKDNLEDLDTDTEDHAVDTLRYMCMTRPIVNQEVTTPTEYDSYNYMNKINDTYERE